MDRKDIAFADVSRSLNRLDGFLDDILLTIQSYCNGKIDIEKSINSFLRELKWLREGDESISYLGIYDCVDFILNNQSLTLAKRAFSIESKIFEIEQIILSYTYVSIKGTSDLLWEASLIISQIQELHIAPFVQETENGDEVSNDEADKLPPDMVGIFMKSSDYSRFIGDCQSLHKPKQIASRLTDVPHLSLNQGNIIIIHEHLRKKGIIKVGYSHFCRLIREAMKA